MNKVSSMVANNYLPEEQFQGMSNETKALVERQMLKDFGYKNKRAMIKDMKKMIAKTGDIDMNLQVMDKLVNCENEILKISYKPSRSIDYFYLATLTSYFMRMDIAKTEKGKIIIFTAALQVFSLFYDNSIHNPNKIAIIAKEYAVMHKMLTSDDDLNYFGDVPYSEIVSAFIGAICHYYSNRQERIQDFTLNDVLRFDFKDINPSFELLKSFYSKKIVSPTCYEEALVYLWQQTNNTKYLIYAVVYDIGFINSYGFIESDPFEEKEDAQILIKKTFKTTY